MKLLRQLRAIDARRPGFPGEHLLVGAVGTYLMKSAAGRRSGIGRALALAGGLALLYRAASGRDGIARLLPAKNSTAIASQQLEPRSR